MQVNVVCTNEAVEETIYLDVLSMDINLINSSRNGLLQRTQLA